MNSHPDAERLRPFGPSLGLCAPYHAPLWNNRRSPAGRPDQARALAALGARPQGEFLGQYAYPRKWARESLDQGGIGGRPHLLGVAVHSYSLAVGLCFKRRHWADMIPARFGSNGGSPRRSRSLRCTFPAMYYPVCFVTKYRATREQGLVLVTKKLMAETPLPVGPDAEPPALRPRANRA